MLQFRSHCVYFIMDMPYSRSPAVSPRPCSWSQQMTIVRGGFAIRTKRRFSVLCFLQVKSGSTSYMRVWGDPRLKSLQRSSRQPQFTLSHATLPVALQIQALHRAAGPDQRIVFGGGPV